MSLKIKNLLAAAVVGALALGSLAGHASAASVFTASGTASDGTATKAEATFDLVGSTLSVVLKNTSTVITSQPALLMGVYWNSASLTGATLSGVSSNGSNILVDQTDPGSAINAGRLGFGTGDAGFASLTGKLGVAASAWGFGTEIDHAGLDGTSPGDSSLNGPDGGAASSVGTSSNKTVVQNSIKYSLNISGVSGFNVNTFLASITGVVFTYGTGGDDFRTSSGNPGGTPNPTINPVPVPAAAWTGLALLAGLGTVAKIRKSRAR